MSNRMIHIKFLITAVFAVFRNDLLLKLYGTEVVILTRLKIFLKLEKLLRSICRVRKISLATERNSRPRSTPFAIEKKVKGKTNLDPHQEAVFLTWPPVTV